MEIREHMAKKVDTELNYMKIIWKKLQKRGKERQAWHELVDNLHSIGREEKEYIPISKCS